MQGETEERRKKRRKKKSKFWYYAYAVVIMLLTIANISIATLLLTYVQEIAVKGNKNSTKNQIISWIQEDPLTTNSLYMLWKFEGGAFKIDYPVYLENATVRLKAPWKVEVQVEEKQVIGCILVDSEYVYFDEEGLVLKKTSEYETNVPLIEGIEVANTEKYSKLEVDNDKVFSYIVNLTKVVKKHKLSPDRMTWEDESLNLYFEEVCVRLGKSNFNEKVVQLPPILKELEGEKGTLQLEHYTSDSKNISFEKAEEKVEEKTEDTDDEKSTEDS